MIQEIEQCHCCDDNHDDEEDVCMRNKGICMASLSLGDRRPSRESMFTNSGNNFVFGELQMDEEKPRTKDDAVVKEDDPADFLFGLLPETTSVPPMVATKRLNQQQAPLSSSPVNNLSDVSAAFIASFRSEGRGLPSSIQTLSNLMQHFPELCYVVRDAANQFEVHFLRDRLIKALRNQESKFPNLVFTSFERGLKHAGLEVTQSTHGQVAVKKWRKKPGFVAAAAKKNRKRNYSSDDEFVEGAKKARPVGGEPVYKARKDMTASEE
jgi:hypothetical protein